MATIAEFTIPADDFPLGRIFDGIPEATVELERVVPTNKYILPYFWVRNHDPDYIGSVLTDEPDFETVTLVDSLDEEGLFRAQWNHDVDGILTAVIDNNLTILSALGTKDHWTFEFRAEDTDQIARFQQFCNDHDIDARLTRLKSLAEMQTGDQYGLTPNQREALLLAFTEGYYDDPRETDLQTLADELGISRPAFANRLRRGTRNIFKSTIAHHSSREGQ
ncbi:helix-turn-helix domain-containing protein [Halorussus halophilus]|uniref:helix-turn-helix domain-containing protein n=1 Tax=Halorussus halophilus TaxID=2650975 RepID=UPI0013017C34|nr:helix-turn-helix domain-containing protein [Halorussus halophilus]